jgi:hypothetical protein
LEICSTCGDFQRAATTEGSRYAEGVEEFSPGLREFDERYPGSIMNEPILKGLNKPWLARFLQPALGLFHITLSQRSARKTRATLGWIL